MLATSLSSSAVSGGATGGEEGVEVAPLVVDGKPHLPFQLQIEYTGQDGSRCMRVITQAKPITTKRGVAEKGKQRARKCYVCIMLCACVFVNIVSVHACLGIFMN